MINQYKYYNKDILQNFFETLFLQNSLKYSKKISIKNS